MEPKRSRLLECLVSECEVLLDEGHSGTGPGTLYHTRSGTNGKPQANQKDVSRLMHPSWEGQILQNVFMTGTSRSLRL